MRNVIVGLSLVCLTLNAVAAAPPDLEGATITVMRLGPVDLPQGVPAAEADGPSVGEILGKIDAIVLIGNRVWELVKGGVAVTTPASASAMPAGADWTNTTGWGRLKGDKFRLIAKNRSNLTFVDTSFTIARRYGGSYEGKGKYLTEVRVIDVQAWAWPTVKFNMDVSVDEPFNAGTLKDPISELRLTVKADANSTMSDFTKTWNLAFLVAGDGRLEQVGGDPLAAARMRIAGAVDDAVDCLGQTWAGRCKNRTAR